MVTSIHKHINYVQHFIFQLLVRFEDRSFTDRFFGRPKFVTKSKEKQKCEVIHWRTLWGGG